MQHFLYFLPLPQGHRSLRPGLCFFCCCCGGDISAKSKEFNFEGNVKGGMAVLGFGAVNHAHRPSSLVISEKSDLTCHFTRSRFEFVSSNLLSRSEKSIISGLIRSFSKASLANGNVATSPSGKSQATSVTSLSLASSIPKRR